jgi:ribosomal protein S18 acetylase RimI-like enzyme
MKENTPICASIMTTRDGVTGYLMHLVTDPDFRRQGLGRKLLTHSISHLFELEKELTCIELAVTSRNTARLLYESLGFEKVNDSTSYVWKKQ